MTENKEHVMSSEPIKQQNNYNRLIGSKTELSGSPTMNTENQKLREEEQSKAITQKVSFFKLEYTFASRNDIILICLATLGSIIAGCSMPFIALLLGKAINNFGPNIVLLGKDTLTTQIGQLAVIYILVGIAIFIGSFMMVFFWTLAGKRIINKLNTEYFKTIMKQEPGWFDANNVFEIPTKVQNQIKIIENGIGNKVGQALMSVSQFIASFLVGYITSWQLSLVLTAMLPLLIIGGWCMAKAMQQGSSMNRESYEKSGGIAEEVLYQIRTVASFVNFDYEVDKYKHYITNSMVAGIKSGFKAGFGIGFIIFVVYCSYSLAVGYGSYLISSQQVNQNSNQIFGSGDVITVLFAIIFGCLSLGQATPNIRAIYEAIVTSGEFFALLNRVPQIDLTTSVEKPNKDQLAGNLVFKNVTFSYPTCKPGVIILENININFEAGKKIAIVGGSGSGKSTILYLILRFYQPNNGSIMIDDYDIKNLDIKYWRSIIGYVPQEPVLFNTSIRNNIIFGREGVTDDEINIVFNINTGV
jgi:ATP-binding cassette subfamily B (MDR/TAP) protein 1